MRVHRPAWAIRSPGGRAFRLEHDPLLGRWRVTPGGYERRRLRDAVAAATGHPPDAAWIVELETRLSRQTRAARP